MNKIAEREALPEGAESAGAPLTSAPAPGTPYKQIWAIGGGKGGVGKTLITANFAITLAKAGASVTLVDLDLGGANLHTCLGLEQTERTLTDLFSPDVKNLSELCSPTNVPNLSLISGAQDSLNVANLPHAQKQKLLNKLRQLPSDYIILDLGAGTSYNTLDFFLAADVGILVVLPEPTSIENAYRFIKSAFYRKLKNIEYLYDARSFVDSTMNRKNELGIRTPADLLRALEEQYPEVGTKVRNAIGRFDIKLVVNQSRTETDSEVGFGVRNVCKKYFGFNLDYLGHLEYDSAVWQSVRRKRPLAIEFPSSPLVPNIQRMVGHIVAEQAEKLKRTELGL
ncbi:MAG TPA: P-loop NTPase [Bdellovibrionota bacterium]|jgi:flagellar biosynthesis protein FlhG